MTGLDNYTGGPCLVVEDVQRLQAMRAAGITGPEVARALDISVRTVHRYRHATIHTAWVAGWPIDFLVVPGKRPVQITRRRRWRRPVPAGVQCEP